ncbi:MAG TPA: ribonuclease III [Bacteroidia bacterium]|jgi:ribonuclease-3|nr:ribonuclease III [Bacteroidia bacterium]
MSSIFRNIFSSREDKALRAKLRNLLGFSPGHLQLYRKAFTHSSAANSRSKGGINKESYERLEFLGDAVLSTVIADYLYMKFPFKDEGFLTKMRSRIVSRQMLGKLALKFGVDKFIEAESGLAGKSNSINGDVFEAMLGAIYLDKGYDFTQHFIMQNIMKFHIDIDEIEATDTDYKSKLIEWAQKNRKELRFVLVEEIGTGMNKQYVVEVTIDGAPYGRNKNTSKKRAEQEAAGKCIEELQIS